MTYDVLAAARRATIRRSAAAAVAVLAVAVLTTVVVAAATRPAGTRPDATAPPGAGSATMWAPGAGPPTPAGSTPAGSATGETAVAVVLPTDLRFAEVAGVALPTSASAGPYDTTGGRARGFAHTPAGAVLAAVHLFVRCTPQVGPSVFEATLREQVVGPDAAAMREQVAAGYDRLRDQAGAAYGQPVGRLAATLAGFRVEQYRPDRAVLAVLTRATDSAGTSHHAATTVAMTWTGTDWALVAPAGGSWDTAVRIVEAAQAATFTPLREGG